ncbi:efflux RND transporter periplasmic adaptor subunit [Nautilia lithotrophica]
MKKFLIFALSMVFLFAYEAKVEPFEIYKIKASVTGEIILSNKNLEAKNVQNREIVKIDDKQNLIDLKNLQAQVKILNEEIINQSAVVKRKKKIYEKYKTLKTKSQSEKDLKFYDYMNALNQLLNLKSQFNNTLANIEKLKDTISKKSVKVKGYVYKIYVNRGDYVAPGVLIADVYDISRQKLTIFVPIEDIDFIKNKQIYINGKKSNFKIYKIWNVPDTQYITSYKVELVGNGLKFGKIVKVDFR